MWKKSALTAICITCNQQHYYKRPLTKMFSRKFIEFLKQLSLRRTAKNLFTPWWWQHLTYYKKNFMAPFYGWGSTASRLEPLQGGSLLFTTKFPEIPGTHFINLRRMNSWVDLGATQWFWTRDPWIGNPAL